MNLGVPSWRAWLGERIADAIERYGVDAYFLDIAGGWIDNPQADMHDGMRRLVLDLRARYPQVMCCGEMHYDGLLEFIQQDRRREGDGAEHHLRHVGRAL